MWEAVTLVATPMMNKRVPTKRMQQPGLHYPFESAGLVIKKPSLNSAIGDGDLGANIGGEADDLKVQKRTAIVSASAVTNTANECAAPTDPEAKDLGPLGESPMVHGITRM